MNYSIPLLLATIGLVACDPSPPEEADRIIEIVPEFAGLVPYG